MTNNTTSPLPDLRTGALYIRVSTHEQDELSPDAQTRLGLDYAKQNNIIVPKEYVFVESVSGRKAKNRHEFQRMIGVAKSADHPIDVIIVWKFSRFARNQEESIVYKSMLKKDNVDVISISEPLVDGPFGSLIERIIEWMDEYYSIRLSGEVLRGMGEKALRHGYQISPPLGYNAVGDGKPFVINEDEYKIIDYIFEQYDVYNKDRTAIARNLNARGWKTKRGSVFDIRTIDRVLRNPFYYGLVCWNDTSFMGTHEVRLSKEQYDKRMEKMQKLYHPAKRRNASACMHWLSGVLKCGHCGASLVYNSHGKCPSFQCWRYSKGMHKGSNCISEQRVISVVYKYFEGILDGNEFTYTYRAPKQPEEDSLKKSLLEELEKIKIKEKRIKLAYENEIDTLEEYKENKCRLKAEHDKIVAEIDRIACEDVPEQPTKEYALEKVRTVYDVISNPDVDYATKGNVLRSLVESITYYKEDNRLEFVFYIS